MKLLSETTQRHLLMWIAEYEHNTKLMERRAKEAHKRRADPVLYARLNTMATIMRQTLHEITSILDM